MKYAFMTFSCPEADYDQVLAFAREYAYDGVELRVSSKHAHGVDLDSDAETRDEARRKAKDAGIALCCVATSCRFANPEAASGMMEDAHLAIDLAGDLGAPTIRVFGGFFPESMSREDAVAQVSECLSELADHAAARNVAVCIETHDAWCDPTHVAQVLKTVDKPAIAVNWDIMHPIRRGGATMESAFEILKPWIKHVHFHDGIDVDDKLQMTPIGEGKIDHRTAVRALKNLPYDGYLSGEWINWSAPDEHLPREIATMRRYEADLG